MMENIYLLSNRKVDGVNSLPLFKIQYIETKIDLKQYDILIFTSKSAVYSIDTQNKDWKKIASCAIAKKTADVIKKYDGNLIFTGNSGHGDQFAYELIDQLKNKKVLYLRGSKVVSNLVNILKEHKIDCSEEIIYKTVCNDQIESFKLPKNSKIIFSSPSTIKCFLDKFSWDDSFTAVCIGNTTASYLPQNINYVISEDRSLESCILKAKEV